MGRLLAKALIAFAIYGATFPGSLANAGDATPAAALCNLKPSEIYARSEDNVVQVISFGVDPFRVAGRARPSLGSGILIDTGLVLTNYHVVVDSSMTFVGADDQTIPAEIIGQDAALDIALLRLRFPPFETKIPEFGNTDDLAVGQSAFVLGYPLGTGKTFTSGTISGLDRVIPLNTISWTTRYIQTDAAVSPGNSGGALIDACGRFIGLVSMASSAPQAENIGYALPMDSALPLVEEILETGRVTRPWHGLYGQMVTPVISALTTLGGSEPPHGFLVETVEPGSPADLAGLQGGVIPVRFGIVEILLGGDVITKVNGTPLTRLEHALSAVKSLKIGDTIRLDIWRDGRERVLTAEITERPEFEKDLWTGTR